MAFGVDPGYRLANRGNFTISPRMKTTASFLLLFIALIAPVNAEDASPKSVLTRSYFTNSLRMSFVPIEITGGPTNGQGVWFSIWVTRVRDYAEYAKANGIAAKWNSNQDPNYPAIMVSWQDATAFCAWLTNKERASGTLGALDAYRLPTDHEWSCAVGIGRKENAEATPESKSDKIPNLYPWGVQWPPPRNFGNFTTIYNRPISLSELPSPVSITPVGRYSFHRNGLCDMVGNVYQWCEDWYNEKHQIRTLRGSWNEDSRTGLLSSHRIAYDPSARFVCNGFRCVLANTAPSSAKVPGSP